MIALVAPSASCDVTWVDVEIPRHKVGEEWCRGVDWRRVSERTAAGFAIPGGVPWELSDDNGDVRKTGDTVALPEGTRCLRFLGNGKLISRSVPEFPVRGLHFLTAEFSDTHGKHVATVPIRANVDWWPCAVLSTINRQFDHTPGHIALHAAKDGRPKRESVFVLPVPEGAAAMKVAPVRPPELGDKSRSSFVVYGVQASAEPPIGRFPLMGSQPRRVGKRDLTSGLRRMDPDGVVVLLPSARQHCQVGEVPVIVGVGRDLRVKSVKIRAAWARPNQVELAAREDGRTWVGSLDAAEAETGSATLRAYAELVNGQTYRAEQHVVLHATVPAEFDFGDRGKQFDTGRTVPIVVADDFAVDSVRVYWDGELLRELNAPPWEFPIDAAVHSPGEHWVMLSAQGKDGGMFESARQQLVLEPSLFLDDPQQRKYAPSFDRSVVAVRVRHRPGVRIARCGLLINGLNAGIDVSRDGSARLGLWEMAEGPCRLEAVAIGADGVRYRSTPVDLQVTGSIANSAMAAIASAVDGRGEGVSRTAHGRLQEAKLLSFVNLALAAQWRRKGHFHAPDVGWLAGDPIGLLALQTMERDAAREMLKPERKAFWKERTGELEMRPDDEAYVERVMELSKLLGRGIWIGTPRDDALVGAYLKMNPPRNTDKERDGVLTIPDGRNPLSLLPFATHFKPGTIRTVERHDENAVSILNALAHQAFRLVDAVADEAPVRAWHAKFWQLATRCVTYPSSKHATVPKNLWAGAESPAKRLEELADPEDPLHTRLLAEHSALWTAPADEDASAREEPGPARLPEQVVRDVSGVAERFLGAVSASISVRTAGALGAQRLSRAWTDHLRTSFAKYLHPAALEAGRIPFQNSQGFDVLSTQVLQVTGNGQVPVAVCRIVANSPLGTNASRLIAVEFAESAHGWLIQDVRWKELNAAHDGGTTDE